MQTTTSTPPKDLLLLLRLIESTPDGDTDWADHCTTQQAVVLRLQLPRGNATNLPMLSALVGISIEVLPDMPVDGSAFRAHGRWHIHVSASLNPAAQLRTALHELKHIIDHPMRRQTGAAGFSDADYERQAAFFADLVLREANP